MQQLLSSGKVLLNVSFVATEVQRQVADAARRVLGHYPARTLMSIAATPAGFDGALWEQAARLGWPGVAVPEEFGGAGLTFADAAVLVEELGRALQSGPYIDAIALGHVLCQHATAVQRERQLPALASGALRPALAIAETGRPWSPDGVTVRAARDGDEWALTGSKAFVPHAEAADLFAVPVRGRDGLMLGLVRRDGPGVTIRGLGTLDLTRRYCEVEFAGARTAGVIAGGNAVAACLAAQQVLICVETTGAARRLLEMTVGYAKDRVQFDRPLASFQAIKHTCANMRMAVDVMTAASYQAVDEFTRTGGPSLGTDVAAAVVSEQAPRVAGEALQVHGGIGMTWEHDLHLYLRRIRVNAMLYGSADWHEARLADAALAGAGQ